MDRTVLLLAGGRSRRFGRDKLRLDWRGRSLRDHVVERMLEISDDVIVLAAHGDEQTPDRVRDGLRVLADANEWPGPLVAVAAGLELARHEIVLVTAADMPDVPIRVLELLASETETHDRALVGLLVGHEIQQLPICVRRGVAIAYASRLVAGGSRRLGALRELPGSHGIPEPQWRAIDPRGDSLHDIDTEHDLSALLAERHED